MEQICSIDFLVQFALDIELLEIRSWFMDYYFRGIFFFLWASLICLTCDVSWNLSQENNAALYALDSNQLHQ